MVLSRRQLRGITALYVCGLLLQGGITLLARLVPAVDRAAPAILQRTQMIAPHSLLHVATGLLALWILVKGPTDGPWRFMLGFGLIYTTLGVWGAVTDLQLGLGLQPFDHPIHIVLGGLALASAWLGRGAA
ncbi:MAG: hypothetical protein ACH37Z_00905 [Anaerolineae bacterium]|nr:hypothetical protein [Ardenticatenia bacterium]HQZ70243.1 hypothetical protein [Anaerolineae bacterium]HRA19926.1 hypothetical protein [Anaerolineae bacterium]